MSKTKDGPTAEATARYISEHAWTRDVISRGRVILEMGDRKKDALDWKVAHLMADLFYAARCGWAGAEYNLEKAGMIEMLFDHVAGHVDDGDCFWADIRWTLFNGGVLPEETIERLLGDPADGDQEDVRSKLEELIQQIIERMGEEGYISMPPDLERRARAPQRTRRRHGHGPAAGHLRSHRQDARLSRLPRAARSARLARQEQLRPPRHARTGDRRRNDRRARSRTSSATR